jgi:hypothetical protein
MAELLVYQHSLDRCALSEGPWCRAPPSVGHDWHLATSLSLRANPWFPPGCCSRAETAAAPKSGGGHNRRWARTRDQAQAPKLVTMTRFSRSALGRPRAANDALRRSAPPLTPVGPRRLQATRGEGARLGCSAILGDRRSEFRPHLAADRDENDHNDGGEGQAHETSHKSAHRHSGIPNTCPDCRKLLISYRGTARFISGRQKGHVVAERRHRCQSGADRPPASKLSKSKSSMEHGAKRRQAPQPLVYAFDRV